MGENGADRGPGPPSSEFPPEGGSLRTSGFLKIEESIVADLTVHADDALHARPDGRGVLDAWTAGVGRPHPRVPVRLARESADPAGIATDRARPVPGPNLPTPPGPLRPRLRTEAR